MAAVILKGVSKRFGANAVVHDVNLEIPDKEFVVMVGPSGCGKTTTLRMIAGLEDITDGEIYIGERLVNDVPPKDRDIAMVFQNYALYPHMTVYANMAFALKRRNVPREATDARVMAAARMLGVHEFLDRTPKSLSGGQRQRVALGRAIVREPEVFLMDEPLSNLDAKLRVQMRAELSKLHNRLQTTMIFVTHDQTEAMTMGDRIVVMKDGRVQQVGTPLDIYRHPDNIFVAGFIGSPAMNFFNATLEESAGRVYVRGGAFRLPFPAEWPGRDKLGAWINQKVVLGLRPEDIRDADLHPERAAECCLEAMIDVVEMMGNEAFLNGSIGEQGLVARVESETAARDGAPHRLAFDLRRAHLFDPATSAAIR
ncbi:MAG: ABC transporter ATP-binding protein [Betaproteobacteria bacterium]